MIPLTGVGGLKLFPHRLHVGGNWVSALHQTEKLGSAKTRNPPTRGRWGFNQQAVTERQRIVVSYRAQRQNRNREISLVCEKPRALYNRTFIDMISSSQNSVTMTDSAYHPVRIGAVSYLNSKPLIEGLSELAPECELILDYPSRLADNLADGLLDVALIPSVECLRDPAYEIVSDACVATRGPVMSVKLYSRVPPGEVRSLALDEGSRTSAALARIMLAERFGVEPQLQSLPLDAATDSTDADAILLIGDRAFHRPDEPFVATWDLGQEWLDWTGLPFVFAMWAARSRDDLDGVDEALCRARDNGLKNAGVIARREAPKLGITEQTAMRYLTHNLHFTLGSAERQGLTLFRELAVKLGLVPERADLVFRNYSTA